MPLVRARVAGNVQRLAIGRADALAVQDQDGRQVIVWLEEIADQGGMSEHSTMYYFLGKVNF